MRNIALGLGALRTGQIVMNSVGCAVNTTVTSVCHPLKECFTALNNM